VVHVRLQKNVVDFLRVGVGLDFAEEEIFRAIGILRTNAFFVENSKALEEDGDLGGRAVYPTFSFLSHSCICNARYRWVRSTMSNWPRRKVSFSVLSDRKVRLRAQKAIKEGEEVTIQYISFMYGHLRY